MAARMLILALFACSASGLVLQAKPVVAKNAAATPADVLALHKQLDTIAGKLGTMLNAKNGAMAHAKVAPTMKVFLKELRSVLTATSSDKKVSPAIAMEKLMAAKQSLAGLMGDLNNRQVSIMKEDNAQRESLMLGVLMTKQKEPIDEQLKILKADDFSDLEVSKALIAKHDPKTALYVQVATYLDAHPNRKPAPMHAAKPENPLLKVQTMLSQHLASLQHEYSVRERFHRKKVAVFADRMKKASGKAEKHTVHILAKREERSFKKWSAMRKHDINAMQAAVDGVKKGDISAVKRAQEALKASMKVMQGQTGGFLYFIQMGHRLMKRDCPYCAAQCVDKCHTAGKPYVQCLTDCADAGK